MDVLDYREAFYGDFGGLLNRLDIPCDRFFVTWDLKREIKRPEYDLDSLIESGSFVVHAEWKVIQGRKGPIKLEIVKEIDVELDDEFLLIEIPVDFYTMLRETDVEENRIRSIPLDWRMKTRQAFQTLFDRQYKIIDFRKIEKDGQVRDFYILKKD
jgi:predicted GNAT superfamily acetyltransferase